MERAWKVEKKPYQSADFASWRACWLRIHSVKYVFIVGRGHAVAASWSSISSSLWTGLGSAICRAHHRAVRSFRVDAARSLSAMASSRVSAEADAPHQYWSGWEGGEGPGLWWLTSVLCVRSCQLMASHHVGNAFLAPGLSHADGHVMPLQRCVNVDVEGDAQTLNLIQKAGHLQDNHQLGWFILQKILETLLKNVECNATPRGQYNALLVSLSLVSQWDWQVVARHWIVPMGSWPLTPSLS